MLLEFFIIIIMLAIGGQPVEHKTLIPPVYDVTNLRGAPLATYAYAYKRTKIPNSKLLMLHCFFLVIGSKIWQTVSRNIWFILMFNIDKYLTD